MLDACHVDNIRCHRVFNEPDKGGTRLLFLFRESEKKAEKETPGGSFFVQLCLSSPKKV